MLRAGKAAGAALRAAAAQNQRGFASGCDKITATLFTGDGIGPEICESVKKVCPASHSMLPRRSADAPCVHRHLILTTVWRLQTCFNLQLQYAVE